MVAAATVAIKPTAKAPCLPFVSAPRKTPLTGKLIRPVSYALHAKPPGQRFSVKTTARVGFFTARENFYENLTA
jgi:hypothetical protein